MANEILVKVSGKDDLSGTLDKAEGSAHRFGSALKTVGKVAAVGLGAAAVGLGVLAKSAIGAAEESIKIAAQTDAVLKSTGGAAQVTAKQVGDLAASISKKTGVDDEAIQTGQNLLLTFTELQNRAGKGNDIFNQATGIMVDMAAAMGGDASSTAIQLGKALNDPTKGITALTRVGVTFSAEQKKQIKVMQEAGDIAGAQKVILAELTKEFGGSAAAQATASMKMKVAFGNLQEQIGGMLIPVVEKVSTVLAEKVVPGMSSLAERVMPKLVAAGKFVVLAVGNIVHAFRFGEVTTDGFQGGMEKFGIVARRVFDWLKENVPPVLATIGDIITTKVVPALQAMGSFLTDKVFPALQAVFGFLMDHKEILVGVAVAIGVGLVAAFLSWAAAAGAAAIATIAAMAPVIAIGIAIAALVAGVIWAYKNWDWFREAVDKAWQILQSVAAWVKDTLIPRLADIASFIKDEVIPVVTRIATTFWEIVTQVAMVIADITIKLWNFATGVKDFVFDVRDKIWEIGAAIWAPFEWAFDKIQSAWDNTIGKIFDKIGDFLPGGGGGKGVGGYATGPGGATVYGGGRAGGGLALAGMAYTVGENGRETLVMGRQSGTVIPNGGGGGIHIASLTVTSMSEGEARKMAHVFMDEVRRIQKGSS